MNAWPQVMFLVPKANGLLQTVKQTHSSKEDIELQKQQQHQVKKPHVYVFK